MIHTYLAENKGRYGRLRVEGIPITPLSMIEGPSEYTLKIGLDTLKTLGLSTYLSAGTALGIIRDGQLIPHDTDIDVEVITNYADPPLDILKIVTEFSKVKLELVRTTFDGKFPIQLAFMGIDKIVFDVFFVYMDEDDDFGVSYSEYGTLRTPKIMIENLEERTSKIGAYKVTYNLPSPPEEYCVHRYGPDWSIPKTEKGLWQDDAANLK